MISAIQKYKFYEFLDSDHGVRVYSLCDSYETVMVCGIFAFILLPGAQVKKNKQTNVYWALAAFNKGWITQTYRDAPIRHRPIIGRPIIGA